MHIKQITLSNFRSFRQQPEIQAFHPGTNSVVGRNGSGKSNLFDAVQFVLLAPRFFNLRQEERQALLHEGSGSAAMNAFVEIVFDNSDHRFSLENSDEVVLRRTVGLKKDEFFLQRKRANKGEVMSLLEGAGFSKSNPYFIVQQGKVQDLCTMSDTDRLKLLKEVAGTTVYDEKKAESLAKMEENKASREKIGEILQDIEERLQELQSEKEELTQYQQLDRQRRALEYTLYEKELRKARISLDQLEQQRADHAANTAEWHERAREQHDAIRNVEAVLKAKTAAIRRIRLQTDSLEGDKKDAVKRFTQTQLAVSELRESMQQAAEQEAANEKELALLDREISKKERQLANQVQPAYDAACQELQHAKEERDSAESKISGLYAKQGRGRQFQSVQERDEHLQAKIAELEETVQDKTAALQEKQDQLASLRRTVEQEEKEAAEAAATVTDKSAALQSMSKNMDDKRRERLAEHDARQEVWRQAEAQQEKVREARDLFHRCLGEERKSMPRATAQGLEALKGIVQNEGLVVGEHYFGMLQDNFKLRDPKYQTAVEVAAQNMLFHVIVDNDRTAATLMTKLEQGKLGRVTFLPLSQLRIDSVQYPSNTADVRPMLETCLEYDPKMERAMQHVFGKKLLARTQELASEWSTKLSMDAITLEGDLCSRKGALTGGYVDQSKSRLGAHAALKESEAELRESEKANGEIKNKAQQHDKRCTSLIQEIQRLEAKQAQLSRQVKQAETQKKRQETRCQQHQQQAEAVQTKDIPVLEKALANLQTDIQRLQEELGTPLQNSLSDEDRHLLHQLKQDRSKLVREIEVLDDRVQKTGVERKTLVSLLQDNLHKRKQELTEGGVGTQDSAELLSQQRRQDLEEREQELQLAQQTKEDLESRLEQAREQEEELKQEMVEAKNELEKHRSQDAKISKAIEEAQDQADRLLNKRSMCISKRETYQRKIQELGSLPPPAELEKSAGKTISVLERSLVTVNKKLKKYSHVNKKAFDQYVNFSEQRESLLKRKQELDQGAAKVEELVESLDRQKDEAINRTFRGVSEFFRDVFKELVPNGSGELILRTAMDAETETGEDTGEETDEDTSHGSSPSSSQSSQKAKKKKANKRLDPSNPDVSLYRGVGIKVRFSRVGENFLMSQLSGGQKALVALGLIFAIQRCDPAPFYLFDELDQALDSAYRKSVAGVIQRQANSKENPTQFIVSTFRPELVAVANRCYGISHQAKVSSIHHMNKKDALHFIASLQSEEEAVGEVKSVGTKSAATRRSSRKRKAEEPKAAMTEDRTDEDDDVSEE